VKAKPAPLERGTGRVVTWLARQVELVLGEHDLTLAQYRLLAVLEEHPEVASALADKLTVSRPSITTVADGLVARGLVERVNDTSDRRRVNHALTDEGRALLRHADEVIETGLRFVLDHLDPTGARDIAAGFASLGVLIEQASAWVATHGTEKPTAEGTQ
jgi:DNA-binding MarR family transcriptional regulator